MGIRGDTWEASAPAKRYTREGDGTNNIERTAMHDELTTFTRERWEALLAEAEEAHRARRAAPEARPSGRERVARALAALARRLEPAHPGGEPQATGR